MKRPTFKYKQQFAVVVICTGEADQRRKFEALKKRGWKLRIVVV